MSRDGIVRATLRNVTSFQYDDVKVISKFEMPVTDALPLSAPPGSFYALKRSGEDVYDIFFYNGEVWSIVDTSTSVERITPVFNGVVSNVIPRTIIDGSLTEEEAFIQWDTRVTSTDQSYFVSCKYLSNGDIVSGVVGDNAATLTFRNSDGTVFTTLVNPPTAVIRYDQLGFGVWRATTGGGSQDFVGLGVASNDNIIMCGTFSGAPVTINNADDTVGATLVNSASLAPYIAAYNGNGTVLYAARATVTAVNALIDITVNSAGTTAYTGAFSGTTTYRNADDTVGQAITVGTLNPSIVSYDNTGFVNWAAKLEAASVSIGQGTAVLSDDSVLVAGVYGSAITVYDAANTPVVVLPLPSGTGGGFLVKYDNAGSVVWTARLVGADGSAQFNRIAVDSSGDILIIASMTSTTATITNADSTTFTTNLSVSSGASNGFLIKFNSAGIAQWASRIGGTSTDFITYLAVKSDDESIALSGSFQSNPCTFYNSDGTAELTLTNSGTQDIFTAKYDTNGNALWAARAFSTSAGDGGAGVDIDTNGNIASVGFYGNTLTVQNSLGTTFNTLAFPGGTSAGFMIQFLQANDLVTLANPDTDGFVKVITTTDAAYSFINPASTVFDKNAVAYDMIRLANKQSITLIWIENSTSWNIVSTNM